MFAVELDSFKLQYRILLKALRLLPSSHRQYNTLSCPSLQVPYATRRTWLVYLHSTWWRSCLLEISTTWEEIGNYLFPSRRCVITAWSTGFTRRVITRWIVRTALLPSQPVSKVTSWTKIEGVLAMGINVSLSLRRNSVSIHISHLSSVAVTCHNLLTTVI